MKKPAVQLYSKIRNILLEARISAIRSINSEMVFAYFEIGKIIVQYEQKGKERAEYGKEVLERLSKKLINEFGKGFSRQNLQNMKQFYLCFRNCQTLSSKLSWSQYVLLTRINNEQSRYFYMKEAESENWSVRELERQIDSMLFERLALSRNKKGIKALAKRGHILENPKDIIKDPYVLEFLNISEKSIYSEKKIETALINNLQAFLLELGKGFTFVARQKRITLDAENFYIDLVFYNRLLNCFVLIDLKIGKLSHQDLGQMQMYVNFYDREIKTTAENKTIGIVLCRDKKETIARFTLPKDNMQIFATKYQLYLPTEKELVNEVNQITKKFVKD